jgi:hypothetical protein
MGGEDMGRVFLPLAICAIVLSIGGCSTGAQREAARMQATAAESNASGQDCFQHIADNPDYTPLKFKTSLDFNPQYSLQMLNDKTSPNKQEISLLYRVYGDIQECRKIALDGASKTHPLILLTYVETFSESDKIWSQATGGRLTWGQFNEGRKNVTTQAQKQMIQANAQIGSQLQNEHQGELAQRQRAAAAFQQWAYQQQQIAVQQQAIAAANRPRMINCDYYGNTAQCTSN